MVQHEHLSCFQEKDLGDDASLRSIDIKEELRRMTLDMVKVTGLLGAVARLRKTPALNSPTRNLNQILNPGQR